MIRVLSLPRQTPSNALSPIILEHTSILVTLQLFVSLIQ